MNTIAERHAAKREMAAKLREGEIDGGAHAYFWQNLKQRRILEAVVEERRRQDQLHPDKNCSLPHVRAGYKLGVLVEEVGEVGTESNALYDATTPEEKAAARLRLKTELIQVAASAVAWVESLEVSS